MHVSRFQFGVCSCACVWTMSQLQEALRPPIAPLPPPLRIVAADAETKEKSLTHSLTRPHTTLPGFPRRSCKRSATPKKKKKQRSKKQPAETSSGRGMKIWGSEHVKGNNRVIGKRKEKKAEGYRHQKRPTQIAIFNAANLHVVIPHLHLSSSHLSSSHPISIPILILQRRQLDDPALCPTSLETHPSILSFHPSSSEHTNARTLIQTTLTQRPRPADGRRQRHQVGHHRSLPPRYGSIAQLGEYPPPHPPMVPSIAAIHVIPSPCLPSSQGSKP